MKKIVLLALALMLALSLVACGKDNGGSDDSSETESTEIAESTENADASSPEGSADQKQLLDVVKEEVNKSVFVDELGYTITVLEVVKNIPNNHPDYYDYYGVALKIRIEQTEENDFLATSISAYDVSLLINGEEAERNTMDFTDYAKEQNWEEPATAWKDEPSEGWLIYTMPDSIQNLTFRYSRQEISVTALGSGEESTIPAKDFDIEF
jgi:hypothetical protein